jgi:DNA-binding NtrC family response regulator
VRLVFATNRDLRHEIEAGRFREDLYWRIRHTEIHLPPLRERGDDVLLLARHFAGVKPISPGAATILEGHAWPGNVRELKHAIEHANALGTTAEILPEDLPPEIRTVRAMARAELRGQGNHLPSAHELVQWYAYEILGLTPTRREAAQVLGIDQKTLRRWLARAGTRVVRENLAEWSGFLATIVSPGADATATDAPSNASAESEHRE